MASNFTLRIGDRELDLSKRALIVGILNRTDDSFFDKGSYFAFDDFLKKADSLVADGAHILDVGGVKAGPGREISLEEELERVIPAVRALKERFDVVLSVDTWNSDVLEAAAIDGALMGNDISGFADPRYLDVAARYGLSLVATHIRLAPRVADPSPTYSDLIGEVSGFLRSRIDMARAAGVDPLRVVADCGLDLGKTPSHSLELLRASAKVAKLVDRPLYLSASNKGFLGELFGLPVDQRREVTVMATSFGYVNGARLFRVHDVKGTRRALHTLERIVEAASS
ncbi:MAG: dihydropteroate synthase [Actinomycetota bacterium]|nr:dihydropteroate synthase [Actinomycetota bacterium]